MSASRSSATGEPVERIAQRYDPAYPLAELVEHPDNPRRGDEAALDASLAEHGFYGAVLVQSATRRIIAGNHRAWVARRRGETTVPVLFLDVDDDRARRLLLVDNRTNDLAVYDDTELLRLLSELSTDSTLAGTGFGDDDLARLLASLEPVRADFEELPALDRSALHECPYCAAQWRNTAAGPVRQ